MKTTDYNELFVPTYARSGPPMAKGKGMYLYDTSGKKYLDFGAGIAVNALGHAHPFIVKKLREHGPRLLHISNFYVTESQIELAQLIRKNSFGGRVFLCNSGTEANEAAIKFARKWAKRFSPEKYHILSFIDCFHGRTYGGLSATAQEKFHKGFEPMMPGFHHVPFNDIAAVREFTSRYDFAAILVEPLQAEGGVNSADKQFLGFLRQVASEKNIALVFDEIQCGMGRTGTVWCCEQYGVTPDIMTLAKPVGGGLPLGAVVCNESIAREIKPGDHGTTFGGNPLACALGIVVLREITKKSFLKSVRDKGNYLAKKLDALRNNHPAIKGIKGKGLLLGLQMADDPTPVVNRCKELGLLLIKAEHNTIRFMPPLIVTRKDIDAAIELFEKALAQC